MLNILARYPGEGAVKLYFAEEKSYRYPPKRPKAVFSPELLEELAELLGEGAVALR